MDSLGIFLTKVDWPDLLAVVTDLLHDEGEYDSDEFGKRQVWHVAGVEVMARADPGFDDDQGIPFASFKAYLSLHVLNKTYPDQASAMQHALAQLLAVSLRDRLDKDVRLIRDVQREIPIAPPASNEP